MKNSDKALIGSTSLGSNSNNQSGNSAELLEKIKSLLSDPPSDLRTSLIREMLGGVVKLHAQPIELLDIKIINRALKELRYAFRVFQPYEHCLKVSIYGSARTHPDDPNFQLAE